MSRTALVTGADGFIGSHLVERLVRLGWDVRAFVFYNSQGSWGWLDECAEDVKGQFDVFAGDIRDPHGARTAVQGVDTVFHLASLIGIPYSYHSPESYVSTNVIGTLNILQASRDLGVRRILHTSTSEVYGTARFVPITEDHPLQGQSPYAATKIGADQLALSFHASFDTPVAVIRPFNTYGPRQSARAVIPTVIGQIASGSRTVKLGSLHPTRDFSFVADTVEGFVMAADCEALVGSVTNLGSGFEISIGDTVKLISDVMNVPVSVISDEDRIRPEASEVERLFAGNERARNLMGFNPAYGGVEGLRRGLQETAKWFCDPMNLRRYKTGLYNV